MTVLSENVLHPEDTMTTDDDERVCILCEEEP